MARTADDAADPATTRRARRIARALARLYPNSRCALDFRDAYQLLVATVLSAQCTDARVNQVTPALFARFPEARALATAEPAELEGLIRPTGFFRAKARHLLGLAAAIVERHGGEVPSDLDALTALPGVGRKTAHVVLGNAFHIASGVVVDTHVKRLAFRLGLTENTDPARIEHDLARLLPKKDWVLFSHLLIDHGRRVCNARRPRCESCDLADLCPRRGVEPTTRNAAPIQGKKGA
ncbi:MAG TPA: endonuclease III [Isosphaeraceae bacterium]|jgi:endonuclease-3|nr:endonuclease III [Isosphaeraceae bacterium]